MTNRTVTRDCGDFHIAGFAYCDGCAAIEKLRTGTQLKLVRKASNVFNK